MGAGTLGVGSAASCAPDVFGLPAMATTRASVAPVSRLFFTSMTQLLSGNEELLTAAVERPGLRHVLEAALENTPIAGQREGGVAAAYGRFRRPPRASAIGSDRRGRRPARPPSPSSILAQRI